MHTTCLIYIIGVRTDHFRVGASTGRHQDESHDLEERRGEIIPTPPLKSCSHLGAGFVIKEFYPEMLPEA